MYAAQPSRCILRSGVNSTDPGNLCACIRSMLGRRHLKVCMTQRRQLIFVVLTTLAFSWKRKSR